MLTDQQIEKASWDANSHLAAIRCLVQAAPRGDSTYTPATIEHTCNAAASFCETLIADIDLIKSTCRQMAQARVDADRVVSIPRVPRITPDSALPAVASPAGA